MLIVLAFSAMMIFIAIDVYKNGKLRLLPSVMTVCGFYGALCYFSFLLMGSTAEGLLKFLSVFPMIFFGLSAVLLLADGVVMLKYERLKFGNQLSFYAGAVFAIILIVDILFPDMNFSVLFAQLILGTILMLLMLSFLLSTLLIKRQEKKNTHSDYNFIIILGTGLVDKTKPSPLLLSRLEKGLELYRQNPESTIIVSGGQGKDEDISEAAVMGHYLIENGVSPTKIKLEAQSRNTRENLEFSKGIIEQQTDKYTAVTVTNNFHILRTAFFTRELGLCSDVSSAPTTWYYYINCMLREFLALMLKSKGMVFLYIGVILAMLFVLWFGAASLFTASV